MCSQPYRLAEEAHGDATDWLAVHLHVEKYLMVHDSDT